MFFYEVYMQTMRVCDLRLASVRMLYVGSGHCVFTYSVYSIANTGKPKNTGGP